MSQRLTVVIGLSLILLTGWLVWARASAPSDGSVVQLSNQPWQQERIRIHSVLDPRSGLHAHDEVVAIDGRPITALPDRAGIEERSLREAEQFTYTLLRDGERHDVTVRMLPYSVGAFLRTNWSSAVVVLILLAVAWFVFAYRPRDPAAQALLVLAALFACGTTAWLLGDQVVGLASRGPTFADVVGEVVLALVWGAAAHFAVTMPGANIVISAPRIAGLYALPFALHGAYLVIGLPGTDSSLEAAGRLAQMSLAPSLVMPVVTGLLMALSYASASDDVSRRRMRWVLVTFVTSAAMLLGLWGVPMLWGRPVLSEHLLPIALLPCVLALAAAVLRYRLFDIEIILRRSLLYGSLTICVLGIYLSVATLLSHLTGAGTGLAAVLGTLLVALTAQPLRDYLQHRVGRLIYGERDDPYEVVSRLGRVDVAAAPQAALSDVVLTLAQTLRLPYAAIQLRTRRGTLDTVASFGHPRGAPLVIPLAHGPNPVGRLLLNVGPRQEPFGPADQRLLDALTRQVSSAASTLLINRELQRSREQLVLTREEERRRLHHRLRDGLEPSITAGATQLETVKALTTRDPDRAAKTLDASIASTRAVIGDVRALVSNLRPPALDQLGLVGAIRERATQLADPAGGVRPPLHVAVHANDLGQLPAAVEVAAFWIAVEAVRHTAQRTTASTCHLRLVREGEFMLEVRYNDAGSEETTLDVDLSSAGERAEELGGDFTVTRNRDRGRVLRARLPIREEEVPT